MYEQKMLKLMCTVLHSENSIFKPLLVFTEGDELDPLARIHFNTLSWYDAGNQQNKKVTLGERGFYRGRERE